MFTVNVCVLLMHVEVFASCLVYIERLLHMP